MGMAAVTLMDRTYWRHWGANHAWHALRLTRSLAPVSICGRKAHSAHEIVDRIPPEGHLCGNCARIIAAQTDVEG